MSHKIYSQKSKIHGMGIFAKKNLKKFEFVAFIKGKKSTVKKHLLFTPEEAILNPDWVGFSVSCWTDPEIPYKYLNHSCDPTCGIKGTKGIYAMKELKAGDELTIDYSSVEANPHWEMCCLCGAENCRKVIKSITFLKLSMFNKYYPLIPTALRNFYIKKNKLENKINSNG